MRYRWWDKTLLCAVSLYSEILNICLVQPRMITRSRGVHVLGIWLCPDWAPLKHITADLSGEKDRGHLSQPITIQYGCSRFVERSGDSLLYVCNGCSSAYPSWCREDKGSERALLYITNALLILLLLLPFMASAACSHLGTSVWQCTRLVRCD